MEVCEEMIIQMDPEEGQQEAAPSSAPAAGGGGGSALSLGRALAAAARQGDVQAVTSLMEQGAPFTTDWVGVGPLHCAARAGGAGGAGAARVLLRAGAQRDARTKVERTPLHIAAYYGHLETLQILLEDGANPNCKDMVGMTPLHWASARGHLACVAALLAGGARRDLRDRLRAAPADLAASHAVLTLLLQHRHCPEAEPSPPPSPQESLSNKFDTSEVLLKKLKQANKVFAGKKLRQSISSLHEEGGRAADILRELGVCAGGGGDDAATTLLSAMRSGRTLLLSDAGKLMLKESSLDPKVIINSQQTLPRRNSITTIDASSLVNKEVTKSDTTPARTNTVTLATPLSGRSNQKSATNQLSATNQQSATNQPSATNQLSVANPTTIPNSSPRKGQVAKMLQGRGKANKDLNESFTLKKVVTAGSKEVRYLAVPKKCVVLQKLPGKSKNQVIETSEVAPLKRRTGPGRKLVKIIEALPSNMADVAELTRLRAQVTSLRQRLAQYEPVELSDNEESIT